MSYITACANCDWSFRSKKNRCVELAYRLHQKKCKGFGATSTIEDKIAEFAKQQRGEYPLDYKSVAEAGDAMVEIEDDMLNKDGSLNILGKSALAVSNERVNKGLLCKQSVEDKFGEYLGLLEGDQEITHKYLGGFVAERNRIRAQIPNMELVQITPDEKYTEHVRLATNAMLATGRKGNDWIGDMPKVMAKVLGRK